MSAMNHYPNCPQIHVDYSHKPERIDSIKDLIRFYEGIPEEAWCQGKRENRQGQRCAIGHYYAAYHGAAQAWPPTAVVGNIDGSLITWNDHEDHMPKHSVIGFLNRLLPQPTPVPEVSVALAVITAGS